MSENTDPVICVDCHTSKNVCMYNNREVKGGFLWLRTVTKMFPGFLCIKCWKLANPKMWSTNRVPKLR